MSNTWLCIPSARPPEEAEPVLKQWRERGYKIALFCDSFKDADSKPTKDLHISNIVYPGYACAVNMLIGAVLHNSLLGEVDWFVTGGDDVLPDQTKSAEEIARECSEHFGGLEGQVIGVGGSFTERNPMYHTWGVMQPTGDRWHEGVGGFSNAPIDRVCGSPWMGREFCKRMYQGKGPLFEGYQHMFVDEELQEVATKMGVLWQRRDLTHFHKHWGRGETDKSVVCDPKIPEHLVKWNTPEHWRESQTLFRQRKAAGFPGSEPL